MMHHHLGGDHAAPQRHTEERRTGPGCAIVRRPTEETALARLDHSAQRLGPRATFEQLITRRRAAVRVGDRIAVQRLRALISQHALTTITC
jgi:hypothetical protein